MGEWNEDSPLGNRGLFMRKGEGGGGGYLPGDWRRGDPDPRPCKCMLLRLRSLVLVVLLRAVSDAGESLRQLFDKIDDVRLASLSLASLSR